MDIGDDQLDMLQKLGAYRAATIKLKQSAVVGLFFGTTAVVRVVSGEEQLPTNLLDLILLVIGVAMFFVSLWQLSSPSLSGLLADGVLIIVLGACYITFSVLAVARGLYEEVHWILVGAVQVGFGIHEVHRYWLLRESFPEDPPRATIRFLDGLVKDLLAMKRKRNPDFVEFESKPFFGNTKRWCGVLLGDAAIFVTKQRDVIAGRKSDVSIDRGRKLALQRSHNAALRVRDVTHKGTMPNWSLERFEAWEAAPSEAAASAALREIKDESAADSDSHDWSVLPRRRL